MLENELNLIKQAQNSESEAFGTIYDYYLPKIYRFVLLKVSNREEAEDITHQVFLKAWTSIDSYKNRNLPFSSWLYKIARNAVIDHYRRTRLTLNIEDEENNEELISRSDLSKELDLKTDIAEIYQLLSELKNIEQEVIVMRFVDDLPIKAVAQALQKTEGAIKLIQHRALSSLKDKINKNH